MDIKKIYLVYFSPGGNTEKVVKLIGNKLTEELGADVNTIDFTLPEMRNIYYTFAEDELAVFGMPTYAGRVPNKLLSFLKEAFKGNGTKAVAITTFGNRSFDSSLSELSLELYQNGFDVFAAGSFACQHHFSKLIGTARPDEEDIAEIEKFAQSIAEWLSKSEAQESERRNILSDSEVKPYYIPLGEDMQPAKFLKATPKTVDELCDGCGVCVKVCPVGVISSDYTTITGPCIKCQACVIKCHSEAKYFDDEAFLSHVRMLEKNYTKRAANFALIEKTGEV